MRRNKMGARKVTQYIGTQECHFDSLAERNYALWLEGEKQAGRIDSWRHHPGRIELTGRKDRTVCTMEPDFAVWMCGKDYPQYHEVKGMATAAWRIKRALLEQEYPFTYVVIDASHVNPPLLFDDRRKRKAERKKLRVAKKERRK